MERLMFGWDFEVDAWSRFWRWNLIKICVRTCDMNWIVGAIVPLAIFYQLVIPWEREWEIFRNTSYNWCTYYIWLLYLLWYYIIALLICVSCSYSQNKWSLDIPEVQRASARTRLQLTELWPTWVCLSRIKLNVDSSSTQGSQHSEAPG